MAWKIEATEEFEDWYRGLTEAQAIPVTAAIDRLEEEGPNLGRPTADKVKNSRHHHMKELRARQGQDHYRMLYAFDPNRMALLLIGGSKTGQWNQWYETNIPLADDLYDAHLAEITQEDTA